MLCQTERAAIDRREAAAPGLSEVPFRALCPIASAASSPEAQVVGLLEKRNPRRVQMRTPIPCPIPDGHQSHIPNPQSQTCLHSGETRRRLLRRARVGGVGVARPQWDGRESPEGFTRRSTLWPRYSPAACRRACPWCSNLDDGAERRGGDARVSRRVRLVRRRPLRHAAVRHDAVHKQRPVKRWRAGNRARRRARQLQRQVVRCAGARDALPVPPRLGWE